MAKPITDIEPIKMSEDEQKQKDTEDILTALIDNKASVLECLELLHHLHERGILELLNGMFGQGDRVMGIAAREFNKPGISHSLDHMMNMAQMLGEIDVHQFKGLATNINEGMSNAAKHLEAGEKVSMFDLVKALKDPEINRTVTALLSFLKGAGKEV
ncbi:DUF1641 domain-containing protein [Tuberibacillus sp. Marseille-P3662]|uniref:DUF1641 domain-containing protein n=1 Tax=Tuberibacillus sp. Marseille-P3662 TaxID=1965358 RepID=UPI000A1CE36B|nr:DUF1641 domain-containing protein [Tuberibacillus sp. Marseille-P3662]